VIVLGAGVVGVNTAYSLARRGLKVAIVDRAEGPGAARRSRTGPGSAMSTPTRSAAGHAEEGAHARFGRRSVFPHPGDGRSGLSRMGIAVPAPLHERPLQPQHRAGLALALESRLAMHALTERHKIDFGHEVAGKMHLFCSRTAFAVARQVQALKRGHGTVQNTLSPKEASAIEPGAGRRRGLGRRHPFARGRA